MLLYKIKKKILHTFMYTGNIGVAVENWHRIGSQVVQSSKRINSHSIIWFCVIGVYSTKITSIRRMLGFFRRFLSFGMLSTCSGLVYDIFISASSTRMFCCPSWNRIYSPVAISLTFVARKQRRRAPPRRRRAGTRKHPQVFVATR